MTGITVILSEMLPPGTIMVSPDIYQLMRDSADFDKSFRKACGISEEDTNGKSPIRREDL